MKYEGKWGKINQIMDFTENPKIVIIILVFEIFVYQLLLWLMSPMNFSDSFEFMRKITFDWDLDGLEVEIRILSIIHLFSFYFLVGSFFVSGFIVFFNNSGKKYRESIGLYSDDDN